MTGSDLAQIKERTRADLNAGRGLDNPVFRDRITLLNLIHQIARSGFQTQNSDEDPVCFYCRNRFVYSVPTWEQVEAGAPMCPPPTIDHATDCPALVLDVLTTKDSP
mgnify:FL=1